MEFRDIPICTNLQGLALENALPDGLYLTRIMNSIRKVTVINGIVSLYGGENKFANRFMQSHFFSVNVVISKLNNKKWDKKSRILKARAVIKKLYESKK